MRCYFLRDNRIEAVELLNDGSDKQLIEQAAILAQQHKAMGWQTYEIWSGRRLVYRSSHVGKPDDDSGS